jgi:hypothetical protein
MPVPGSSTAGRIWSGPGNEVNTTALCSATAWARDGIDAAPGARRRRLGPDVVDRQPVAGLATRQPAIGVPIAPVPTNPVCVVGILRLALARCHIGRMARALARRLLCTNRRTWSRISHGMKTELPFSCVNPALDSRHETMIHVSERRAVRFNPIR